MPYCQQSDSDDNWCKLEATEIRLMTSEITENALAGLCESYESPQEYQEAGHCKSHEKGNLLADKTDLVDAVSKPCVETEEDDERDGLKCKPRKENVVRCVGTFHFCALNPNQGRARDLDDGGNDVGGYKRP